MIKAIFFDWGGVLTKDSNKNGILKIFKEKYNLNIDTHTQGKFMDSMDQNKLTFKNYVKEFNEKFNTNFSIEEIHQIYSDGIVPYEEMLEFTKELKDKYKIFILSNNSDEVVKILKEKHQEMLKIFDKCFFSNEINLYKPKKDIFEFVLKETNLKAEECIFIDDKKENTIVAESLGIKSIIFENVEKLKEKLSELEII